MIGADVGGTKMNVGRVRDDGTVEGAVTARTAVDSPDAFFAGLDGLIEQVLDGEVGAIGLGVPSTIDQRAGRVVTSVHIPLKGLDLRDRMADRFGLPVGIDNDGNAAAIAEWRVGAGRGTQTMVMLTLGTGVGGGLILDGRPFRGATGAGAELGHMVLQYGGPDCLGACDGHGHFEALASGSVADSLAAEILGGAASGVELVEAARAGNEQATEAIAEIGRRLGAGIGSLINVFEPEAVVVGGGFGQAGELLLAPAREVVAYEALRPGRNTTRIVPAELGPRAGLVGAGFVAFEALEASG